MSIRQLTAALLSTHAKNVCRYLAKNPYLLLLLLEIVDITSVITLIFQRLLKGPELSLGQEKSLQLGVAEEITASWELTVVKGGHLSYRELM